MPGKMTPERALIILNQCNTDGRIKVDREELKEAVKVIHEEMRYRIPIKPQISDGKAYCENCFSVVFRYQSFCEYCGQAIDWGDCT